MPRSTGSSARRSVRSSTTNTVTSGPRCWRWRPWPWGWRRSRARPGRSGCHERREWSTTMVLTDPRWLWGLAALPLLALLEWRVVRGAARRLIQLAGARQPNPLLAQADPARRVLGALLEIGAL